MTHATILIYCRVWFGAGHWFRIAALMQWLRVHHRVVCIVDGALTPDLPVPSGVEIVPLPARDSLDTAAIPSVTQRVEVLLSLLDRVRPDILIVEYFPFGRREVSLELVRLLHAARKLSPAPRIVCSLRDIQQRLRPDQARFDQEAVTLVNRHFDAVFVHADPGFVRFDETFADAARLSVPVHHTGFVVPKEGQPAGDGPRAPVIVVSAGGGRGGEALLFAAVEALRRTDLSRDFSMRMIAGALLPDQTWHQLQHAAADCPHLTLLRWVPSLREELSRAAVSVSRCGYNTTLDLIRSRVPALVVPYATADEDEQTTRADRLVRAGLARMLSGEAAEDPAQFAAAIRETASFVPRDTAIDCDGGPRTAALLDAMMPCSS